MTALLGRLTANRVALAGGALVGIVILAAVLAPLLAPHDPNAILDPVGRRHLAPGGGHLLGTDAFSRDVLSRVIHGARVSLAVGLGSALLAVLIGGAVGVAAGLAGPFVDGVLMRAVDVLLALPRIFLLMAALALWEGVPVWGLVVLIAGTGWFGTSRLVRQHTRALARADFITAARALGGRTRHIMRHLLPHLGATVIVSASLDIGNIMIIEAGLSYLGLGVRPPTPSWGAMILEGKDAMFTAPWEVLAPGVALVLTVVAFNLLGDALRDALNPRLA
jgi:peptide/nickel transport system permease protein